jgi:hypothetical protein
METSRVVEVLHDRGEAASPRWLLGSGFVVRTAVVLTAAHNVGESPEERGPAGTVVRCLDGAEYPATTAARSDMADIALLVVPQIKAQPVMIGRVDRHRIDVIHDVMAAGFPNFKHAVDRPAHLKRQPAQPVGSVPTVEDYSAGELTLKVETGWPATPSQAGSSPWEGLSGAGVIVGELLIGIAIEHHLAEGLGALRVMPLTRLADLPNPDLPNPDLPNPDLPNPDQALFCAVLGIDEPDQLPMVGREGEGESEKEGPATLVDDLEELFKLGERGLLGPGELKSLRITAVKVAKGWR